MSFSLDQNPEVLQLPQRLRRPYSWVGHIPFAFHLIKLLKPRIVVELGVHIGNSFAAFCQAASHEKLAAHCFGVDTWEGDEHAGFYDRSIFTDLSQDMESHYKGAATLLRMTFDEALEKFAPGSIDLLHIDGLHTYEAVRHDFESWLPKLSDRAVVLFHDTAVHYDDFGVWKLWDELKRAYPCAEFEHSFGLGVAAVGRNVPPEVLSLLASLNVDPMARTLFHRLGESIRLSGEAEELGKLAQDAERAEKALRGYERLAEVYGIKTKYEAEIAIDSGYGFVDEQTLRLDICGDEKKLQFDLRSIRGSAPGTARLRPINCPVALKIRRIEVIDDREETHLVFDYSSNKSFEDGDELVFEEAQPEILFDLSAISDPVRVRVFLEYTAFGVRLQALLLNRLRQSVSESGLMYSTATGRIFLTPQFSEYLATDEQAESVKTGAGKTRPYDEKLLAAAMSLHRELRAKDAIIQQKTAELRESQAALAHAERMLESGSGSDVPYTRRSAGRDKELHELPDELIADLKQRLLDEKIRFHDVVNEKNRLFRELENHHLMMIGERDRQIASLELELAQVRGRVETLHDEPADSDVAAASWKRKAAAVVGTQTVRKSDEQ